LSGGLPTVTSGPASAKLCPTWLKPQVTPLLKTQVESENKEKYRH